MTIGISNWVRVEDEKKKVSGEDEVEELRSQSGRKHCTKTLYYVY